MPENAAAAGSLGARKRRRARAAIVAAAYELFAERGFHAVTVAEIAERAEVGRTTFFRYFGDKQEVLFAEDESTVENLVAAMRAAAADVRPLGDRLGAAVAVIRAGIADGPPGWSEDPERSALTARLLRENPELHARHLLKQERQAAALAEVLVECGASAATAVLATQLVLACLRTAAQVAAEPRALPAALDDAFARLDRIAAG
ncbi:TetR/AcrR family transcriptional regulator [Allonocardiopsis opalescens]|uniref:TetR family transcriptional regulator n=1 Tax=Allonocardiopsis opalescens TaxID=1144618 RepID=A0A2T0Q7B9_9ACTN|nr:TetR/AcrR family transcriptional regulator [Allonocardiopsis opalescens]PRX99681.1 TetR family transcriptional regulator [Allonocardiopsis opalescens]